MRCKASLFVMMAAALSATPFGRFGRRHQTRGSSSSSSSSASSSSAASSSDLAPKASHVTKLTYGQIVHDSLDDDEDDMDDSLFDYDAYSFTGQAGDVVIISAASEDFDTFIELYDTTNHSVAYDDDGDGGLNSRLRYTLPRAGEYRFDVLAADDYTAEGDYVVTLGGPGKTVPSAKEELTVSDRASAAVSTTYGQSLRGSLAAGDALDADSRYFDKFTFAGKAGDNVVITVESTAFDPIVFLLDPDNKSLASDDDGGGGTSAKLSYKLPRDGTYRADVLSSNNPKDTGAYTFQVRKQ